MKTRPNVGEMWKDIHSFPIGEVHIIEANLHFVSVETDDKFVCTFDADKFLAEFERIEQ